MNDVNPAIASFVAVGDSFTEGMNDMAPDGGFLGWADRLAEMIAARDPSVRYANLAVRGKLLGQIVNDQVPAAVALLADAPGPSLVSIAGGGNDLLRPGGDPDSLAELFDAAVARLRQAGSRVLLFTGFDPTLFPLLTLIRGRVAAYNMHLRAIADARGCDLVDLWSMRSLAEPAAWSADRLHLSSRSHREVAERAAEALGIVPAVPDRVPAAAGLVVGQARESGRPGRLAGRPPRGRPVGPRVLRPVGAAPHQGRLLRRRPCPQAPRTAARPVTGPARAGYGPSAPAPASRGGRIRGRGGCCGPTAWPLRTGAGPSPERRRPGTARAARPG